MDILSLPGLEDSVFPLSLTVMPLTQHAKPASFTPSIVMNGTYA